jgi:hypothetical protein
MPVSDPSPGSRPAAIPVQVTGRARIEELKMIGGTVFLINPGIEIMVGT